MVISVLATNVFADIVLPTGTTVNNSDVNKIANFIIGLIQAVGAAVAVVIILIIGIKYMTSSPEGKADYKGTMIPYLVGAALVFAGSWIASAIAEAIINATSGL